MALFARGLSISSLPSQGSRLPKNSNPIVVRSRSGNLWTLNSSKPQRNLSTTQTLRNVAKEVPKDIPKKPVSKNAPPSEQEQQEILSKLSKRLSGKTAKFTNKLFVNAVHQGILDKVESDAKWLVKALGEDRSIKQKFLDRSASREPIFLELQQKGGLQELSVQFLAYLDSEKQLKEVTHILNNFLTMVKDYKKEVDVVVTLPTFLDPSSNGIKDKDLVKDLETFITETMKTSFKDSSVKTMSSTKFENIQGIRATAGEYLLDATLERAQRKAEKELKQWAAGLQGDISEAKVAPRDNTEFFNAIDTFKKKSASIPESKVVAEEFNHFIKLNGLHTEVSLHQVMDDYLAVVHAISTKAPLPPRPSYAADLPQGNLKDKKVPVELASLSVYIRDRVATTLDEQWMFDVKVTSWKQELEKIKPSDPWHTSYNNAIKSLEKLCDRVVPFTPSDPLLDPFSIQSLKKLSVPELLEVPLAELQKLPLEDLLQLPLDQMKTQLDEEFPPIDFAQVRSLDLKTLKPIDIDVICMDINNQLKINLNTKRFAVQRYWFENNRSKAENHDERNEFIRTWGEKSVEELNQKFKVNLDPKIDVEIKSLFDLKNEVETKIKALGMVPLPSNFEW